MSEVTYKEAVANGTDQVVVLIGASWCPPCRAQREEMNKLGVEFCYLDVDKDKLAGELATQGSVPELQVWRKVGGKWVRGVYVGRQSSTFLKSLLRDTGERTP